MALSARDAKHGAQIEAGIQGRKGGHSFEAALAEHISALKCPFTAKPQAKGHLYHGDLAPNLVNVILNDLGLPQADEVAAFSVGALATQESGQKWLMVNGIEVRRCKSDVIVVLEAGGKSITKGVSVKQCNNVSCTNAQLFCTGARGFCDSLRTAGIDIGEEAVTALRMFCGEGGHRPLDLLPDAARGRASDPRRWFWEELPATGKAQLEELFTGRQDEITRFLLQKAYPGDQFVPEYLLHKTKKVKENSLIEAAIYPIDTLIKLSRAYKGFEKAMYRVKKGSHPDPVGVQHEAPRFGIVQFQRLGNQQNATELQFNLKAGYFYELAAMLNASKNAAGK
jgi:hypothetical protein